MCTPSFFAARRAALLAGLMLSSSAWPAPAVSLPQVALQVDWRWVEAAQAPPAAQGLHDGARVVGTGGAYDDRPGVTLRSQPAAEPVVRTLTVMNGEPARLEVAELRPTWEVQLFRTPKGDGGVLVPGTVSQVQALAVRPRWAGGTKPVELEVSADSRAAGGSQHWSSTVQLPLNAWQTVLQASMPATSPSHGELSSTGAVPATRRELQLRVRR
jgi:hypothetical protein